MSSGGCRDNNYICRYAIDSPLFNGMPFDVYLLTLPGHKLSYLDFLDTFPGLLPTQEVISHY